MLEQTIECIEQGESLDEAESQTLMTSILEGHHQTEEIKRLILAMREKGESIDEIAGFVKAFRAHAVPVHLPGPAMDVCGTGGTGKDRFNISTAAAFVLAAAGVPIAKHGNRGSVKPNGSFDFIEALGIPIERGAPFAEAAFRATDLCFLFARSHHPAMRHVAQARKEISGRTVFNLIGPLSNPAAVPYQILGTYSESLAEILAKVILRLPIERALVIVPHDGRDELTTTDHSTILDVRAGKITKTIFDPGDLGLAAAEADLAGGDAIQNAALFKTLMADGILDHPITQMIALNAGAGLMTYGTCDSIKAGFNTAIQAIASGQVWRKYNELLEFSVCAD